MKRFTLCMSAIVIAAGLAVSPLWAQSGTWAVNAPGNWSVLTNWSGSSAYASGADQTANFTVLSGNTNAVTDDVPSNTVGYLVFGAGAGSIASAGNTLTLQTTLPNTTPTITVPGSTSTISTALSGTQGFVLTGGGNLTLATNADTWTGAALLTQGTLTMTNAQASTAGFVLYSGAAMAGSQSQSLVSTNYVQILSGTATVANDGYNGGTLAMGQLFSGNGTINWAEPGINNVSFGATPSLCIFGNFGGTIYWGVSNNNLRIESNTGNVNSVDPFATFNFGTGNAAINCRNGTTCLILGAVANGSVTSSLPGDTNSGGHDVYYVVGSANENTTFNGVINNGANPTAFSKVGIGSMTLTGTCTASDNYWTTFTYGADGGTLGLNFATNKTNLLATSGTIGVGQGGTLYLQGNTGAATSSSQTVAAATATAGGGFIVVNPNGGAGTTLNLNSLTAPAAGGSLNFAVMPGSAAITTTSGTAADGTYGGRVTYTDASGNTDFATAVTSLGSTSTLGRYTGYSAFTGTTDSGTTDYALVNNGNLALSESVNLLKISTNLAGQSLNLNSNSLTVMAGGLLFTSANAYSISNGTLQSNTATNSDLIVQNYGSAPLTVDAAIVNSLGNSTLTIAGKGVTALTNSNTYNGVTYVTGGTLSVSSNANLGTEATGAAVNLYGGTLQATASFGLNNGGAGTNDRNIVIAGGGGTFDVTSGNTLTVSGVVSNLAQNAPNGVTASYYGPLIKTDAGTLVLSSMGNTYYGATIIDGGVLSVSLLTNGNSASGIGQSPSAAPALVLNGGILQYTGTATSTDRSFVLTPNGGGIDASGSGPLIFSTTSNVMLVPPPIVTTGLLAGSGPRVLTLTGTNTGQNVFAGQIVDGTGGATGLFKTGGGQWVLTNNNTYSGATTVNNGTLTLSANSNNNIASSTVINVGFNGTLNLSGLNSSTLALTGGQTLTGAGVVSGSVTAGALSNIQPGTATSGLAGTGASNISGNLSLLNNSGMTFGLNSSNLVANVISVGGTLSLPAAGTPVNVALYVPNSAVPFTPPGGTSTYDLIEYGPLFSNSSLVGSLSELSVSNANAAFSYSFGTIAVSGQNYIDLTINQLAVAGVWATNGAGNWSNPVNWTGGVPHQAGDTATFSSAITAPAIVTLDQPETVSSVTFTNTASYTISGTNTLTLSSTAGSTITDTLGSHTIATPLALATNTGASISNAASLTLSGPVSGAGALTKNGNGTLVLSASNGFGPAAGSVGTTIIAGTVQIGNNSALSTGDVSVAGNGTIQAGAPELTLANNFIIAGGTTVTLDTQGQTLTLAGLLSESPPSGGGSLTVIGTGTLIVTNSNTYTGTTTINGATLQLDNGGSNGYVGGPIVNNGTLILDRGDTGLVLSSVISGTGSLAQIGAGMSTLNGANTYSGNTTISAGTLQLANSLALQDSTLIFNNPNGTLSFGTLTAASLGGLSGSLSMSLQNPSSAAVALTVGGNNLPTTYSGGFSGSGSLEWNGPSSWTLTGSSNIAGALQMSNANGVGGGGSLILPAGSSLAVSSIISYGTGGNNQLNISGATLNVSGASTFNGASNGFAGGNGGMVISSGLANLTGGLNIGTDNQDVNVLALITGGTVNSSTITIGRNGTTTYTTATYPTSSPPTFVGLTNAGVYITGGLLAVSGSINVGSSNPSTNSTASFRMDGGQVDVSGPISIGLNNTGRWSVFDVNGGSLVDSDTTSGITIGGISSGNAEFLVRAGVTNVQLVTFGQFNGGGEAVLNLTGGQLYVGSGGMVYGTGGVAAQVYLAGGTLAATAPWSSAPSVPITLTGGSSAGGGPGSGGTAAVGVIVQTADQFGNGNTITFNGQISGSGGMTITGTGGLVLTNNSNGYSGNTVINAGSLVAGGANTLSPNSAIILNNGLLEPSAGPQTIAALTINGGSVDLNSAVTLSSLTMSATGAYTLAAGASGSLTLTYNSAAGTDGVISATGGSQTLLAPITLTSNQTDVYATGSSTLAIGGGILDGTGGSNALLTFSSGDNTGVLVLGGSNNFGGGFTVYGGIAIVESPSSLLDGSNVSVGNPQELGLFSTIVPAGNATGAAAVPEPGTLAIATAAAALAALGVRRKKRRIH